MEILHIIHIVEPFYIHCSCLILSDDQSTSFTKYLCPYGYTSTFLIRLLLYRTLAMDLIISGVFIHASDIRNIEIIWKKSAHAGRDWSTAGTSLWLPGPITLQS